MGQLVYIMYLAIDILLVDSLHKLADDEGHTLNSLDLFLSSHKLALQTPATC